MNISGRTKIYGLVGNPIENSLSPYIHNKLAEIFFFDLVYVPFKILDYEHEKIFSALKQLNISGVNVTSPYKNLALEYFYDVDENVKAIGAVNTIKNIDGKFFAFNTDVCGVEKTLDLNNVDVCGKNILIFGSGGAAKSVIYAIAKKNPAKIYIANRTFDNARKLSVKFGQMFKNVEFETINFDDIYNLPSLYLVIQATTLGFKNNLSPVGKAEFFSKVNFAFDLIYSPWKTKFLIDAEKFGAKIINGFEMLIFQAVKSFEIWNDISVDKDIEDELFLYMQRFI